ncbi:MAG TPA: hypothetical protein H9920_01755 [Candidatus Alistipes faecavium]|uniref:hypothetical protein n=1 Tax=uncultured Alistipes sp. TaxID=538949 RepID=UPI001F9775E1|nr:hypothetical protein [uncultured Alistipes sp.]HJA96432.1 hypothetical protein [Candidatus Alistipes faecavium]
MKKIFSFVIALAAVAMVGCCGNSNKKAAEAAATETAVTESACAGCTEKCDSTTACEAAAETTEAAE